MNMKMYTKFDKRMLVLNKIIIAFLVIFILFQRKKYISRLSKDEKKLLEVGDKCSFYIKEYNTLKDRIIKESQKDSINKKYKEFMKKLGDGKDIQEDLENYMYRVERVEKQNAEIRNLIETIDTNMDNCIQKIGMVRYNAFKDTGSDLSFALAMLDEKNNGVVLNGIYSREMSNIYAKPVENGKSKYTISEEEQEAIQKAIENKQVYKVREQ